MSQIETARIGAEITGVITGAIRQLEGDVVSLAGPVALATTLTTQSRRELATFQAELAKAQLLAA